MKVNDMEKLSEIQKKSGSWNIMLSFILLLCSLMLGYIIYQNSSSLDKIANTQISIAKELGESRVATTILSGKLGEIERKLDMLFMEKFNVTAK